ncbi:hypothetical protein HK102_011918 [Quaeritorhiza haematococci]|nr:hypothetical protein HK102_011918 [Quaeritorhiza haematococci]
MAAENEFNAGDDVISRTPGFVHSVFFLGGAVGMAQLTVYLYGATAGFSWQNNFPVIAVVTLIMNLGLIFSYNNSTFTSQLAIHRLLKADPATASKKTNKSEEEARNQIIKITSLAWALFFNNLLFLILFSLLTLGLGGAFPVPYKYAVSCILPPIVLGFLTSPTAARK